MARGGSSLGVFNSPKGFGLVLETSSSADTFNSFTAYTDIYGLPMGRCLFPGYKFNYSHNKVFKTLSRDGLDYNFYIGPGVTLGYVREFEPYIHTDFQKYLSGNFGAVACASATAGCRVEFPRHVALNLSWTIEGGVFLDRNEDNPSGFEVSLYRNGLVSVIYPQLSILYVF